jgi:hypothetical protein
VDFSGGSLFDNTSQSQSTASNTSTSNSGNTSTTDTRDDSVSQQFGEGQQFSAGAGATVTVQDQGAIAALKELVGTAMSNVKSALGITAQASQSALETVSASKGVPSTFADYAKWLVPAPGNRRR